MILAINEKYTDAFNEELKVTPQDYSGCLSFAEACYQALIEDHQNWDNFEKSIIYYEVHMESVGEKVSYAKDKVQALGNTIIGILKKFAEKLMGVLLTWRQRVNGFIAKISVKFISKKAKDESKTIKSIEWDAVYKNLNEKCSYIGIDSDSEDAVKTAAKAWVKGDDISVKAIIEKAKEDVSEEVVANQAYVKDAIGKFKSEVSKCYNDQLEAKHKIEAQIKEVKKSISSAKKENNDEEVKQLKGKADAYKLANKYNFTLMQARLNAYNEYIKMVAKLARSFEKDGESKKDSGEATESQNASAMMFGNFNIV